ncbi:MAG: dihydroorotate dehydrogenase [Spirochaetales bacterium]
MRRPPFGPEIRGRKLANVIGVASGTFGYGSEYEEHIDLSSIGALYTKAVTLRPRPGNDVPRIIETSAGLLNSIGLANVGMERFVAEKLPSFAAMPCAVIANVAADFPDEYAEVVAHLEEADREGTLWGYEINLSCPNVKAGGVALGSQPVAVEETSRKVRDITDRPVIVKLTPNVTDITEIARAAEAGGADAVSCINTVVGMAIDTKRKRPVLPAGTGGLSGPAVLPIGVAAVYRVSRAVGIPVIGLGGISSGDDAIQYLLAGAEAVQLGTINFVNPHAAEEILAEVERYAAENGLTSIAEFHALLEP